MLRTSADPAAVLPAVRRTLRELDPNRPLSRVATIDDLVAQSLEVPRALSLLIGALSVVALVLAVVGIYGVMAHYVQQHREGHQHPAGARRRPGSVLRLIVGRGVSLVGARRRGGDRDRGGAGPRCSCRASSSASVALDPATFAGVAALLVGAAALACWIPAARAVAVEPAVGAQERLAP